MRALHWLALPLSAFAVVGSPAFAAGNLNTATGQAVWTAATRGKTTTIYLDGRMRTVAPAGAPGTTGGAMQASGAGTGGGVAVSGSGTAPVNGKGVPVAVAGNVTKDALAGAVEGAIVGARGGVAGAVAGAAIGAALPLALNWAAQAGVTLNPQTGNMEVPDVDPSWPVSDGYLYSVSGPAFVTREAACTWWVGFMNNQNNPTFRFEFDHVTSTGGGSNVGRCYYREIYKTDGAVKQVLFQDLTRGGASNCPGGWYVTPAGCVSGANLPKVVISGQPLIDRLVSRSGNPDPQIVREVMDAGQTVPVDALKVSGPAQVSGPTTISITNNTTNNSPTTTTTTTTNNYTYNGATITNTGSKTTTQTKDKDGNTTSTTEETTVPGEDQPPEPVPVDTPLGEVPKLYERKYPDGMVGIWNDKGQQLKQTQLFQLPQQLMPTGIGGGSCPSFKVPLDFAAFGDFGQGDVSPPCWVWDVAKVIVLIGAAILARALIFGG
ncbi:hypothetical protein [Variovorax gossypii]